MATSRASAISAVTAAVVAALNVSAYRTLCPGGVYRGMPLSQRPPFTQVGPARERPWDRMAKAYGTVVTVPVRVTTRGDVSEGDTQLSSIVNKALDLLDRKALSVTGWTWAATLWTDTDQQETTNEDGTTGYIATVSFDVHVIQA